MVMRIDLSVKFRAFMVTWKTVRQTWRVHVPEPAYLFAASIRDQLRYDWHGVKLTCELETATEPTE